MAQSDMPRASLNVRFRGIVLNKSASNPEMNWPGTEAQSIAILPICSQAGFRFAVGTSFANFLRF
jgi:hypothetical protein